MPSKSKASETGAAMSDDAIRQRAYYLWEADGRPDGRGDHYWLVASAEAAANHSRSATAAPAVGKPAKGAPKASKSKEKPAVADKPKAKVKAAAAKPAKKAATKPRAAAVSAKKVK